MSQVRQVNLALQGGGSHGAFSWGVIDRLLDDERLDICAVSGASAGAMNAVVLADGLAEGDRSTAKAQLRTFWEGVAASSQGSPIQRSVFDRMFGRWSLDHSPGYILSDLLSRVVSPYSFNPMNLNPVRDLLNSLVDFGQVRTGKGPLLFISATNVTTGRAKIFDKAHLTADHIMASACLPTLFQAVEIDSIPYWDGGFTGNPPLWPLFDKSPSDDLILIEINPVSRPGVPRTAHEIQNRLNEISFNAALMHELRTVDFVTRLLEAGRLQGTAYRRVLAHRIADEPFLASLGASSKLNAEWDFLELLFEKGRAAGDLWLKDHFDDLGQRSSMDLRAFFAGDADALDGERLDPVAIPVIEPA